MDILLSLPIVSYFFSTSLTSWSTSLNLLFFYMTWSTLVLSHSPLKIEIVGTTAIHIVFWLIPSLIFLAFDTALPSLSESIKHNGASALPPRSAKFLVKLTCLILFNLALETGLQTAISFGLASLFKTPVFRTSTALPLPWQMIKHIAILFSLRELLTYYIHRHLLHPTRNPKSKPEALCRLPALHTRYGAHAHRSAPFSLLLKADHPLPYLLHRFIPLYLPALLVSFPFPFSLPFNLPRPLSKILPTSGSITGTAGGLHLLTYLLFLTLSTLEETLSMSGYTIIPGLLMRGMTRRTALHYSRGGKGNYGSWGLLDWAHGTGVVGGDDVVGDLKDEVEKHRVRERVRGKGGEVVNGGRKGVRKGRSVAGRTPRTRARSGDE